MDDPRFVNMTPEERSAHAALMVVYGPMAAEEITRLRASEAALRAENERLKRANDALRSGLDIEGEAGWRARDRLAATAAENAALRSALEKAREGLEPFAKYLEHGAAHLDAPDREPVLTQHLAPKNWHHVTVGDFRRARSALAEIDAVLSAPPAQSKGE